jgi:hypothetical protein
MSVPPLGVRPDDCMPLLLPLHAASKEAATSALTAYVADFEILIRSAPLSFMKVP